MSNIIGSAREAFVSIDVNGTVTDWNPAAEVMFGWSRKEIVGFDLIEKVIPEADREQYRQGLARYRETRIAPILEQMLEFQVLTKGGHCQPIEFSISTIELDDTVEFIAFVRDITARKKGEQELRDYASRLKQSNDDLEQFAYVASHDLQEPLRAVTGFCQLLELDYHEQLDDEGKRYIANAVEGSERMRQLIQDLLEYSRVNRQGRSFGVSSLKSLCEEAVEDLQLSIRASNAVIEIGTLPTISCDSGQMIRLFQNLIGNSLRYCRDQAPRIAVSAVERDDDWVISVKDNGIGIAKEFYQKIFVIFQRLHTRDEYDGTGLGLAICNRIVQRHGGEIWVESDGKSQSEFFFNLPKTPEQVI